MKDIDTSPPKAPPTPDLSSSSSSGGRGAAGYAAVATGALTALLAVATVWSVPRPTGDLYVGLAAGRDILDGKLGAQDDWAFTTQGRVWVNQNWGTHMLYYLAYRATGGKDGQLTDDEGAGEAGLLVLKFLMILTGTTFLVLACRRRGVGWPVALLVAAASIAAGRSFIDLRPNLTTLMFVPIMLHLLYRTAEKPSRSWLVMVVFGLIWANLHGGFFFGLLTMGFWAVCMILPPALGQRWLHRWIPGFAWAGAMGVVCSLWAGSKAGGAVLGLLCLGIHWFVGRAQRATVAASSPARAAKAGKSPKPGAEPGRQGDALAALRARCLQALAVGWPYLAATALGFLLAGVVTPFGVHNLFRDYSHLKMRFWEVWNLTHPFVVMASGASDLWKSVIEWHSIFTPSPRTFGTSWEFFCFAGLLGVLAPVHVIAKLVRGRAMTLEDIVLVAGSVVLGVAVTVQAVPMLEAFDALVAQCSQAGIEGAGLNEVLEQRGGWTAAVIIFSALALLAGCVGIGMTIRLLADRESLETYTPARVGAMIFDVTMAAAGVYLAFGSRRFIPVSVLLLAPLLARRVQWILGAAGNALAGTETAKSRDQAARGGEQAEFLRAQAPAPASPAAVVMWWLPTLLAGAALFGVIARQAQINAYSYWPTSPRVRHASVLKNMIVYSMFPPAPRDFINDNHLSGRIFNEWRWEGYLHWYCPQLEMFVGGRAQQVYDVETYKLQRGMLGGEEPPTILEQLGVRWMVVPRNESYEALLPNCMYAKDSKWAAIFCDGENIVLADSALPECLQAINGCLDGKLKYRSVAFGELSRAFCLLSQVVTERSASPATARLAALAALKKSAKDYPIYLAYAAMGDIYRNTATDPAAEIAFLQAEYKRLSEMDWHRLGGDELLRCRQWVINTLVTLCEENKREGQYNWAVAERARLGAEVEQMVRQWR
jgi:hypothetical protein